MKIREIEVIPIAIPLHKPVVWAAGSMTEVDWLLVRIVDEDGQSGVAEAIPRPMIYGETQASIKVAIDRYLSPQLIGEDTFCLERIWKKMGSLAANPAAKSAIDVALHDLNARRLGMPVHRLLGGPVRQRVAVVWMIGMSDETTMLSELEEKLAEGFRAFKVKGGLDPDADIRLLKKMHKTAPVETRFYIDANMKYDRESGFRVLHALEGILDCIEEPLAADDDAGRQDLARRVSVPFLGDESVFTVADVYRQLQLGALRRISLKLPRTGFSLSRKIVTLAEAANVKLQINTQSETTLGTAACLQLAAAFSQIEHPSELAFYLDVKDSLITKPLILRDGHLYVPDGVGNGVEVDWEKVERYRVR